MIDARCAEPQKLYSPEMAAQALGVSLRTFQRYVAQGWIKKRYNRMTLRPRYLGADLNKFYSNLI